MHKTPFYARTKLPGGTFVDHETGITVHGHNLTKIDSPIGRQTMKFLRAGGLVKATDKELAIAEKKDRVIEGDVFTRKTKIVMKPAPEGSVAASSGMKVPVEVPLDDEELEEQQEEENEELEDHLTDDDEEDTGDAGEESDLADAINEAQGKANKTVRKDGKAPAFTKKAPTV